MEREKLIEMDNLINAFIEEYSSNITEKNAAKAINSFKEEWKVFDNYAGNNSYGKSLIILSSAYYFSPSTNVNDLKNLTRLIEDYDNNPGTQYKFPIKHSLYFNLGMCWHKLGSEFYSNAVEAFKKYVYYLLKLSSNTSYSNFTAYSFKRCDKYLFQSLINDELNLSSPSKFNDPFDCPIRVLLQNDEEISSLLRYTYDSCLKVACFIRNKKLPYMKEDVYINDEYKINDDKEEFLKSVMWSHYADSHKGICIKYKFTHSIPQIDDRNITVFSYLKDVRYSDDDMSKYSEHDSINMHDAFFLKGQQWEYENELRYIYFDINGKNGFQQIKIPNTIEAIYFGLACSVTDINTIINIMKNKKLIVKDHEGNVTEEKPIKFYKIKMDLTQFGNLIAEEIQI